MSSKDFFIQIRGQVRKFEFQINSWCSMMIALNSDDFRAESKEERDE
jgi:hypothetical protein